MNSKYFGTGKSSIQDTSRNLFNKLKSLIASAENFETLKVYEQSLKLFREANDLAKSLSKKQLKDLEEDDSNIKNFFVFFGGHIRSKIKTLEQLVIIKKSFETNTKADTNSPLDLSNIPKMNNTAIPKPNMKLQIPSNKEEVVITVDSLIKTCEVELKELVEIKKASVLENKSILSESTLNTNQSYFIPDAIIFKNHFKNSYNFEDSNVLLEKLEEKFKIIKEKLKKIKNLYEDESKLMEEKVNKQKDLEKVRISYSKLKKIYDNAFKGGIIIQDNNNDKY